MKNNSISDLHLKVCIVLVACIVFFCVQCGKKTLPVPMAYTPLSPVDNLDFEIEKNSFKLRWTYPVENLQADSIPGHFLIERAKIRLDGENCEGCPQEFSTVSEISYMKTGVYEYNEILADDFKYVFRVVPVSKNGARGPQSGSVTFLKKEASLP